MAGPICTARKNIAKRHKSITSRIGDVKDNIVDSGEDTIKHLKKAKTKAKNTIDKEKRRLKKMYLKHPIRHKRPDMTLLVEIVLAIALAVILYYAWPYITGNTVPGFSREQFNNAAKLPITAFNIEEMAKVNLEVSSLKDYASYFKSSPYSLQNSGIYDLMVNVAILPLIIFFIQFVLPPFVISYIIWFIIRFWPYVMGAAWGWFKAMYLYFTKLIQGKLGCKWYIRMVTGWKCKSPNFGKYYNDWRRRYIDRPIYYEKLKYIKKYRMARKNYYTIPWDHYISVPYRRYKVKAKFTKKIYVNRANEVILKKIRDMYPQYYTMPRNKFYKWLLGNNRHLAGVYAKTLQAKAQIEGKPYESMTENGKKCTCPGTKTPLREMKKHIKTTKGDIKSLIRSTNKVYDKVTSVKKNVTPDCGTADKLIAGRKTIVGAILASIVVSIIGLYVFSTTYGTPVWLNKIMVPTSKYITNGTRLVLLGKSYWSLPLIYIISFSSVLTAVLFT